MTSRTELGLTIELIRWGSLDREELLILVLEVRRISHSSTKEKHTNTKEISIFFINGISEESSVNLLPMVLISRCYLQQVLDLCTSVFLPVEGNGLFPID